MRLWFELVVSDFCMFNFVWRDIHFFPHFRRRGWRKFAVKFATFFGGNIILFWRQRRCLLTWRWRQKREVLMSKENSVTSKRERCWRQKSDGDYTLTSSPFYFDVNVTLFWRQHHFILMATSLELSLIRTPMSFSFSINTTLFSRQHNSLFTSTPFSFCINTTLFSRQHHSLFTSTQFSFSINTALFSRQHNSLFTSTQFSFSINTTLFSRQHHSLFTSTQFSFHVNTILF